MGREDNEGEPMIDPFQTTGILGAKHFDTDDIVKTSMISQIEQLRAENERLREALKPFIELPCAHMARFSGAPDDYAASEMIPYGIIRAARKALGESDD